MNEMEVEIKIYQNLQHWQGEENETDCFAPS